ncbi:MAG: NAD(P)H-dependent oxidoreductase [Deltaproteobacteria bacterium]|nr:NAD(P)H-dependent oxidoreductase [Deltaproteobacteria bacterium]MBW2536164.1 NAD(P)H-dependent oxidoreductase [Deltaproteobacteria bacterium]
MNIVVIAGSPKGETSVTLQYVRYLEVHHPEHRWEVVHVASRIRALERRRALFDEVIERVQTADLVLWAFPVYVLLVPAGYKRFIELIGERGAGAAFAGKYAASLSTSIHFHDHCPHDYLRAVSEDLGMRFVGSHSPEMHDLEKPEGQAKLLAFGRTLLAAVDRRDAVPRRYAKLDSTSWAYQPGAASASVPTGARRVVILHDAAAGDDNLRAMVGRLRASFDGPVTVHDLSAVEIKGNCLGCLRCGHANRCAYEGKDDFIEFYRQEIMTADVLVFAGAVVDRHWSSRWRQFFDRAFFKTHQPSFRGKQLAFVVSGPLAQLANLQEVLTGYAMWQEANLVGFVSDEVADSVELDAQLDALAARLMHAAREQYVQPFDFRGVGGAKIFRDHIFGPLRFVFTADHRYYTKRGYYDFPTRSWRQRLLNFVLLLLFRVPRIRREFERRIKSEMIAPVRRQVERAAAQRGMLRPTQSGSALPVRPGGARQQQPASV